MQVFLILLSLFSLSIMIFASLNPANCLDGIIIKDGGFMDNY